MTNFTNLKLHKKVTKDDLRKCGFRISGDHAWYDTWVYKNILRLSVVIDMSDGYWSHEVLDMDHGTIYPPYYFWDGGKNLVLEEVNENVTKEFERLCDRKIFWKPRERKLKDVQSDK